jgi:RimJ/RimL family protein N-acetyltransferase
MVSFPELPDPLTDGVISLRPFAERDIPDVLIAYQDDPELHVRLGFDRPPSAAELGRRSELAEDDRIALRGVTLTILVGGERSRGELNVHHVHPGHARCELGLWLEPGARGQGHGARALQLVSGWLTERCGFGRLAILTAPDNAALRAAAEHAGFGFEGVLRGYTVERGRRVDSAVLSRLAGER